MEREFQKITSLSAADDASLYLAFLNVLFVCSVWHCAEIIRWSLACRNRRTTVPPKIEHVVGPRSPGGEDRRAPVGVSQGVLRCALRALRACVELNPWKRWSSASQTPGSGIVPGGPRLNAADPFDVKTACEPECVRMRSGPASSLAEGSSGHF